MAERKTKTIPLSPKLASAWERFLAALSGAAEEFTGRPDFPVPPATLYMLIGAKEEADKLMLAHPAETVAHDFVLRNGRVVHELQWTEK